MAVLTVSGVVREILSENIDLSADVVIAKAKALGLKAEPKSVREAVHNLRSKLKRGVRNPVPVVSAARTTPAPASPPALTTAPPDVASVLANVALVNKVMTACGGEGNARQLADAVRACGGVDAFLQHLDVVAGLRASE